MSLFNKDVAYGCAEEGGEIFFVALRYDPVERRVVIKAAEHGRESDFALVRRLARNYGRNRVWVPVKVATASQMSDIRVVRIDDGGGIVRGKELARALETQLSEVEADQNGDYARTLAGIDVGGQKAWIGGSIPRGVAEGTYKSWRERGFGKPCVASRHVALANLFLALHPDSAQPDNRNRILVCWQGDLDVFCYLGGNAFIDCGSSPAPAGTTISEHLNNIYAWADDFAKQHGPPKNGLQAVIVAAEPFQWPEGMENPDGLSVWTIPWKDAFRYARPEIESLVNAHPDLALRAVGLALHGV